MRLLVLLLLLVVVGPVPPASADDWRWPLDGPPAVSRPFAAPAHRYAAGHRGADLPSAPGAPVRAAAGGVVSYAGLVAGRGVVVVVHGDLRTTYEPVSALVGVGDLVAAGEVVGTLDGGHLGCPAAACLHWGLRRGDDHLDPVRLVRPGPVRLLPLDGAPPAGLAAGVAGGVTRPAPAAGREVVPATGARRGAVLAPARTVGPAPAAARSAPPALAGAAAASLVAAVAVALRRRG